MKCEELEKNFDDFIEHFKGIPPEDVLKELQSLGVEFSNLEDCKNCIKETAKD